MIRPIRRRLRLIRYYSANRRETIWTRLGDWALFISLLLAVPATWLADRTFTRTEEAWGVVGTIRQTSENEFTAHVAGLDDELRDFGIPPDERWATFMIEVEQMICGLPLETSIIMRQPTVDLRQYGTARKMTEVETGPGSLVGRALRIALAESRLEDSREILALWREGDVRHENNWLAWAAGSVLWWIGLFVLLSLLILFARIMAILFYRGQSKRWEMLVSQGRCPYCGYDLRGLEFSERCPECGELQVID